MVFECKKGPLNVKIDIKKRQSKNVLKALFFGVLLFHWSHIHERKIRKTSVNDKREL